MSKYFVVDDLHRQTIIIDSIFISVCYGRRIGNGAMLTLITFINKIILK